MTGQQLQFGNEREKKKAGEMWLQNVCRRQKGKAVLKVYTGSPVGATSGEGSIRKTAHLWRPCNQLIKTREES